jgi:hypothetical protein
MSRVRTEQSPINQNKSRIVSINPRANNSSSESHSMSPNSHRILDSKLTDNKERPQLITIRTLINPIKLKKKQASKPIMIVDNISEEHYSPKGTKAN